MSIQAAIKRFSLIIDFVSGNYHPTKKEIIERLYEEGINISTRTFDRDLDKLRNEFGIFIESSAPEYRYAVNKEKSFNLSKTLNFFETTKTAGFIHDILKQRNGILDFIEFEHEGLQKGTEHLPKLVEALNEKKIVKIRHRKFGKSDSLDYELQPVFLKQYQGRWYVIGTLSNSGKLRAFAIDRIETVKKTTERFKFDKIKNSKEFFENYVGVSFIENKPEPVQLWVSNHQAEYLRTLPLHLSQTEIRSDQKGAVFGYHLVPTYEFIQLILKEHFHVKVLKPEWLREEVVKLIKRTINQYK